MLFKIYISNEFCSYLFIYINTIVFFHNYFYKILVLQKNNCFKVKN
jgi:hypothetical protein